MDLLQEYGDLAIVTVRDTETGIDPGILPRFIDKFTSKSFHGIGLGLFISRSIIEGHGGKLWLKTILMR